MSNADHFKYIGILGYWERRELLKNIARLNRTMKYLKKTRLVNGGTLATFDYVIRCLRKEYENARKKA